MSNLFWICVLVCLYKDSVLSIDTSPKLPEKVFYQVEDIDALFNEFAVKYNKKYTPAEFEHRRKVFGDNLIKINRWNREQPDVVFGINPFSDLTFEEFIETHTGFSNDFTNDNATKYVPTGMAPETLDWRQSNIEGQYAKKSGQLISLSEQQSLDCNSKGCHGGVPHEVMQGLIYSGCMRETDYPYEDQQDQCRTDESKIVVKVVDGNRLFVDSEEDLKDAVAYYGPLSIGLHLNEEFKEINGGILKPRTPCNANRHAVLLIGYGAEGGVPYWLIKNSWGQSWNENGYLRMVRGQGACHIGIYVASATVL